MNEMKHWRKKLRNNEKRNNNKCFIKNEKIGIVTEKMQNGRNQRRHRRTREKLKSNSFELEKNGENFYLL